ncbi:hypothetical protein [Neorhodopirellula pilleata]|uniref:Uncharacterized protein n=1 Tax=Neorhodopirellula pilleata TaxID=2714738 RepID=A0A5C6A4E1_9BACT|nr:hypothetical protein [Neorhodopirellula pilleata]TWT94168.1 hypothetical protein Pla100_37780 [Neorhodopirellula pilleata]
MASLTVADELLLPAELNADVGARGKLLEGGVHDRDETQGGVLTGQGLDPVPLARVVDAQTLDVGVSIVLVLDMGGFLHVDDLSRFTD